MQSAGYWYDGQSAARHTVRIGLDMGAQALQVQPEALAAFGWPLGLLRLVEVDLRGMTRPCTVTKVTSSRAMRSGWWCWSLL